MVRFAGNLGLLSRWFPCSKNLQSIISSLDMESQTLVTIKSVEWPASDGAAQSAGRSLPLTASQSPVPSFSDQLAGRSGISTLHGAPCTTPVNSDTGRSEAASPASPIPGLAMGGGGELVSERIGSRRSPLSLSQRAAQNRFQAIEADDREIAMNKPRSRQGLLVSGDMSLSSGNASVRGLSPQKGDEVWDLDTIACTAPAKKEASTARSGNGVDDDVPLFLRPFDDKLPVRKSHSDEIMDFSADSTPVKSPAGRGGRHNSKFSPHENRKANSQPILDLDSSGEGWGNVEESDRGMRSQRSTDSTLRAGNPLNRSRRRSQEVRNTLAGA